MTSPNTWQFPKILCKSANFAHSSKTGGKMLEIKAVYLAPKGYELQLKEELQRKEQNIVFELEGLIGTSAEYLDIIWAENIWYEPQIIKFESISEAAKALKNIQRNWVLCSRAEHRRAALIAEQLPKVSGKPLIFGDPVPTAPLGSWTLLDRNTLLGSAKCSSPFPNGAIYFEEDKTNPPNRAYLKLWESFTRLGVRPKKGELCLDLGSSPGGWSWVLAECGAHVFSVDKAPLAPHIVSNPLVEYCNGSAFGLEPKLLGDVDWMFSDVACYPERLLGLVEKYLEAVPNINLLCTIKLSGQTDFEAIEKFLKIPNSSVMHLCVNKHELTWVRLGGKN